MVVLIISSSCNGRESCLSDPVESRFFSLSSTDVISSILAFVVLVELVLDKVCSILG